MRKHTRWLIILTATIVLPSLMLFQPGEAKRGDKKKSSTTSRMAGRASLLRNGGAIITPQSASLTPVSMQAVGFAISPAIRDMTPEEIKTDPVVEPDVKEKPIKTFRVESTSEPSSDAVVQTTAPEPAIPSSTSFEGMSIFDTIALGQGFLPPDTEGDVGPNHYVQTVNSTYRVWNKAGVPQIPTRTLGSIWASIPGPCANTNAGDAIVLYDSYADRWFISQFCTIANPNNHQLIAISKTGDPTGAFYLYDFMMPNNKFNDYPKFGVWPDGYYMTDNQFNQAGTTFLGGGVFAFDRAKMLSGDPTASFIYFDLFGLDPNLGGMLPSDADGLTAPPPGAPNVFAYFTATEFGDPADALRLFDFHADFAVPGNSTFTERAGSPLAVAAFDPRTPTGRDDIEQPPPANNATAALDAIGDRLMNRLQYRNFGTHESLIVNHTVNVGTGTTLATHQAAVRYYELRNSGGGYGVNEQATFSPDTNNRWMGSAAMDREGNLAVGYSISSTTVFPGVRYAGRLAGDPPNGLFQGEATMQSGGFVQVNTASRWGDYSSTNLDPIDDCTFWHTNEYYLDDQPGITAEWHTRIGNFKVNPLCTAPAQGTLQVNVTNCATGLPIQGVSVSVDGNLYGATGATGQNNSQLAPGSYSVSVSANGYFPTAPVPANITNGNTTVINVCLTGMPNITSAGSTITAESCAPADGGISPGETVTIDFGMKNIGTAPASNLVATLQATGGITSPSGPQSYGAVPNNGSTVSRSFTFTADSLLACGNTITATFDLQDGATNLGTVTYTFKLGVLGFGVTTATYSSGDIAVPIPDVASVDIPISVSDLGAVADVNVRVRLNHTFDGDLELRMIAPDGTTVLLSDNRGGSGDNFGTGANDCSGIPTVFDDSAATGIAAGTAPFAGSFKPEQPLSGLNGKDVTGTWRLRVTDTAALDVGTVFCAQVEISRREYLCCPFAGGAPEIVAQPPATLVSECGTNGAPDPGEVVTMGFPLANAGSAPTTNLVATLQSSGGVTALSGPQSYGVLSPIGGASVSRNFTFAVSSLIACGGTFTATFDLNDGATNLGTVSFTIVTGGTLTNVSTFSNTAAITIPATGTGASTGSPATPYPSNISVSGITGTVTKVRVKLNGLSHTFPGDVDMLLVGPLGQKFTILSDVIGGTDMVNINYTLDDGAAAVVPSTGTPASGTFRPTNYGTGDLFPAPAPAAPYQFPATAGAATFASVFNGQNPNGTWSLYVVDDAAADIGSMSGGWALEVTTQDPVCEMFSAVDVTNVSVDKASLWPPNHQMQEVMVNYTVDACSSCSLSVSSNEPVNGTGDGDTAPDWEIVDNHHVRLRAERAATGNGRIYTITITCQNGVNSDTETVEVHVDHNINGPSSGSSFRINTPVTFTGTFWDKPGRTHTAAWSFDGLSTAGAVTEPSGSRSGSVRGTYSFSTPGVYKVKMTVRDNTGLTSWVDTQNELESIVVIYDPSAGYTIGGGWLDSPLGAFAGNPNASGKVTFGFTSKYFKNASNPKGETQLSFRIGEMDFNAVNFDYLAINGARAQFKGLGKLNGGGAYNFILTVIDGDVAGGGGVDLFRIKIWNKSTGAVVYDTQPGASEAADPTMPIGGSIIIQK